MTTKLHHGDCIEYAKSMEPNSVDAIVTDPPYHLVSIVKRYSKHGPTEANLRLAPGQGNSPYERTAKGFMGKVWDGGDIAQDPATWAEFLRIAKPGAHLLAFGGTRTFHRMMVAIEDAGWEIRDTLGWLTGQGFPKSHNLKGEWDGWGSALKPAWEPIVLARKPLEGSIAENVLKYGTGAININGCRVPSEPVPINKLEKWSGFGQEKQPDYEQEINNKGRWPANVITDGSEEVVELFPNTSSGKMLPKHIRHTDGSPNGIYGKFDVNHPLSETIGDSGSAARFYYVAKASVQDREEGLEDLEEKLYVQSGGGQGALARGASAYQEGEDVSFGMNKVKKRKNIHPTCKPTELMKYLCRLVTPPNGVIFDPFMGSGSTGKAAILEGFQFIGCDTEGEYVEIAKRRIAWAEKQPCQPGLGI